MSTGAALRTAALDFYRQSWRLVVLNTMLSVALLPLFAPASTLILGGCAPYPGLAPCPASGRL